MAEIEKQKTYAFLLSGEHDTLPRSEALALLEICSSGHKEISWLDQCLIVEAKDLDARSLEVRLAMSHSVIEVLAICDATLDALSAATESLIIPRKTYRLRAKRIKQAALPGDLVERQVGKTLAARGYRADLTSPELNLKAIITGDKVIIGREISKPDRSSFEERRPHLKPFFYPGVLMPRIARALINISQTKEGQLVLDPFSGTGGILVEACLAGLRGLGLDVQKKLIRGAKENLAGLDYCLMIGDAKRLPLKEASIDGAVLDIPYGRSAIIEAGSKEQLLEESLAELHRVLKPGSRMVIIADRDIRSHIIAKGFQITEIHKDRVHRSLTRQIFVCERG